MNIKKIVFKNSNSDNILRKINVMYQYLCSKNQMLILKAYENLKTNFNKLEEQKEQK